MAEPFIRINGVPMSCHSSIDITPDVLTSDENRNEAGYLDVRVVRPNLTKFTIKWNYMLGSELIEVLGKTWMDTKNTNNFKYLVRFPFPCEAGYLEDYYYYKLGNISVDEWNDDPMKVMYKDFSITFVCY